MTQIDEQAAAYDPPLIGALLRLPWETVRRRMLEGLHERGFDDISAAHLVILQYPGPNGLRPSELAERSRMSKQAVNYLLGQMERLGYIARREHAGSGRFKYIELTERGVEAVRAKREIVLKVEADWERTLGPERFALLREMLIELQSDDERPVDATTFGAWTDGAGSRRLRTAPERRAKRRQRAAQS